MAKKVTKRFFSLFTLIMILGMTLLDCFWYKPMQAYAASTAIELPWNSGSWGSVVADLLGAFGGSAAKSLTSATTAIEFGSYLEERRVEVLEEESELTYEERLAKVFPFLYKDKTNSTKTLEVTGRDYVDSHEMMNKIKSTVSDTFELPLSFIRSFQSFLVDKLNFNAADGSEVTTVYTLPASRYFDIRLTPLSFPLLGRHEDFYLTASGPCWAMQYSYNPSSNKYRFYVVSSTDTVFTYHYADGRIVESKPYSPTTSGFSMAVFTYYNSATSIQLPFSSSSIAEKLADVSENKFYIVDYSYAAPVVDTSFSDAKAVTWTGNVDLKTTLENQAAADDLKAYIDSIFAATLNPDIPDESESAGSGEGEGGGDVTLTGILDWLSKIYNGVISLPKNLVSAFDSALAGLGTRIDGIPAALADIGERISTIPDDIGKELAKLGDWLQTIPGTLAGINDSVLAVPKAIGAEISAFFSIDTVQINNSFSDMTDALKAKLSALNQIIDIFDKTNYSFSDTPPIIRMKTPDALKFAIHDDEMIIMDLTQFAELFSWCRTILAAMMWVAFGKWVIDQFDVKFHVG